LAASFAGATEGIFRLAKNGADEVRTRDPLLAKQVLYQLSYDPDKVYIVMFIKNRTLEIYFVRSIRTQKTAGFKAHRFLRPSPM
jgi:hypothetical protein